VTDEDDNEEEEEETKNKKIQDRNFAKYQGRILIRRSGLAERYNAALCTSPLDLTSAGFVTGTVRIVYSALLEPSLTL
jgi:hypothetical protein